VVCLGTTGRNLAFFIERAVTVMVITCPHALGLAIPLVVAVSTAHGARKGLQEPQPVCIRENSERGRGRLAAGEIAKQQFESMKKDIE